jgi:hypothetical protein
LPSATEATSIAITKKKIDSNRERALEFAKRIPKPKLKTAGSGKDEAAVGAGERMDDGFDVGNMQDDMDCYGVSYAEASKLQELESKHLENRRHVEAIKKAMGL